MTCPAEPRVEFQVYWHVARDGGGESAGGQCEEGMGGGEGGSLSGAARRAATASRHAQQAQQQEGFADFANF